MHALLNSAITGKALSITCEAFSDLLEKLSEENKGNEGDIYRTTTQKDTKILDVDQVTTLNAKVGAMQHCMTLQFKQLTLIQAPVNVVQQTIN